MESIPNQNLTRDTIPPDDADWTIIWEFAHTFNGYKYWGSFEKCAEIANTEQDTTLTELRTCLFFECQRWHHYGEDPDEESTPYIRNLVGKIRIKIANGTIG